MGNEKCRYCSTTDNLQKNRSICKKCHAERNLIWWNNLSEEERKKRHKKFYQNQKKKNKEKSENDLDFKLKKWIMNWKNRWNKSNLYRSRKNLDLNQMILLAKKGLEKYPYMDFSLDKKSKKGYWASVDRIDSSKDYSDINNLQFIPYWLNSAKLDLTTEDLKNLMQEYLKIEN